MKGLILLVGLIYFSPRISTNEISTFCSSDVAEKSLPNLKSLQSKQKQVNNRLYDWTRAKLGRPAPSWKGIAVINGTFQQISSTDYRGKYLILLFYPLDFTFVCPTEIHAFNNKISELRKLNTEVVAVSVDSQFAHLAWINTPTSDGGLGNISFPLLSDLSHEISKSYGVFAPEVNHAHRGLFIIDPKGIIRHVTLNDVHVGRNVDETVRLIQAYQHTDTHNEVCPAGWKPGEKTITVQPSNPCHSKTQEGTESAPKTRKHKIITIPPKGLQCKKCEDFSRKQRKISQFFEKGVNFRPSKMPTISK
ncbi:unnamed protein product [Bemisia tabaci]|uniref:thioredoxin-dependent peroxiredoxin n=1 Tax=Bemisia tabaci TaxID=7038 RepID=A0A9P0AA04_BEMTA|nr:unnamed protein product [Bemisia tabaci]